MEKYLYPQTPAVLYTVSGSSQTPGEVPGVGNLLPFVPSGVSDVLFRTFTFASIQIRINHNASSFKTPQKVFLTLSIESDYFFLQLRHFPLLSL